MLAATTPHRDGIDSEDALQVLGRVADAFDHPSFREPHKELRLMVSAIRAHRPQTSYSSQESQCQHARFARCDSSFDISYDGDVELVGLAGAAIGQTASYASEETVTRHAHCYEEPRSPPESTLQQDDMFHDITKMLLVNSPLDRLNYLARIELKNTGWFERNDQWAIVEMGLSDLPLPVTPPRIIAENILTAVPAVTRRSSPLPSPSPSSENKSCPRSHSPQSPSAKPVRIPSGKYHERDPFPTGDTHDPDEDKPETKARARAQARLQTQSRGSDSDSSLDDFSTLSYAHASTPIRTSRPPRINPYTHSQEQTQTQTQTRRQLGRVVRNFVKRMLSPSSGVGGGVGSAGGTRGTSSEPRPHPHVRHVDATSTKKRHTLLVRTPGTGNEREGTPRSDTSGRSGWTFASVGSWTAPPECQQAHGSNRWSGLWH